MGGPTPPYARAATDISDSSASGRAVLTGTGSQGAAALGLGAGSAPTFSAMNVSGAVGSFRTLYLQTGGVNRFTNFIDNAAEGGNNAGSNYGISRFDDNGGFIDNPLMINRATGQTSLGSLAVTRATQLGSFTVSALPAGVAGAVVYASNARKIGEAAGAGTGVIAYFSNGSWRRLSDDTAVAA